MFFNCNWCRRACCRHCSRQERDCKRPEKNYCTINDKYDYDEGDECRDNRHDKRCRHEHKCFKIKCEKICCKPQNNQNDCSYGNEYDFCNQAHYCRCNNLGNFNQNNYQNNINENPTGLYYYNNNFNDLNY